MGRIIILIGIAYLTVNAGILWWFWRALRETGAIRWAVGAGLLGLMAFFPLLYRHAGGSWPEVAALRAGRGGSDRSSMWGS